MLVSTSIKVGRQAVELVTNDNRVIIELDDLKKKLTLFEKEQDPRTKRFRDVPKNHFYLYEEHDSFFKIIVSINSLRHIIDLVKRARVDHKVTIESIQYKPSKSSLTLKPDFIPREEQDKFIQALVKDDGIPAFLLDLQPGYGKSAVGYHSMVRMKQKFGILVKPTFLDKWVEDVYKYSNLTEDQIFVIRGRDSLLKLFDMNREEVKKIDVYVISMRTITNYHYLCFTENYYKVRPENFMEYTGITNILNDESHKEFEALFKVIMWMNPYKLLGLSATMDSNKPGENDFYNLLYPKKDRLNSMFGLNKYLTLMFFNYKLAHGLNLPHKTFKGYNHIMLEQAIMKNINVLTDYIEMILYLVDKYYIEYGEEQKYEFKNPKCLLFFSTVDMCLIMTKKIKEVYKHLKVQKYTAEDKYEDMIQSDIIISTNQSLSTGIDIPNLITAIQTVSIGDQQLNIQAAGRLRDIKGKDVLYVCVQTDSIVKQQQLKLKRLNTLRDRVRHIRYDSYNKYIGIKGAKDVGINNNKTVYKTPFFGKKTFYKSPFGKSGTKQKTWDRNKGRYRPTA